MVLIVDFGGVVRWASDASIHFGGFTSDELVGVAGLDILHPDDVDRFIDSLLVMSNEPGPFAGQEGRFRQKNGTYLPLRIQPLKVLNFQGHDCIAAAFRHVDLELQVNDVFRMIATGEPWEHTAQAILDAETVGRNIYATLHFPARSESGPMTMGPQRKPQATERLAEVADRHRRDGLDLAWDDPTISGWFKQEEADEAIRSFCEEFEHPSFNLLPVVLSSGEHVATLTQWHDRQVRGSTQLLTRSGVTQASAIRLAFERERAIHQLQLAATTDSLTGLLNRAGFYEQLERASDGLVAYFDLNHFKAVNDNYGHRCGDEVLVEIARRLRGASRPTDVVARVGGDEFVMWIPGLRHGDIDRFRNRLTDALSPDIEFEGLTFPTSASIGFSLVNGPNDADRAVDRADKDMLRQKRHHPGRRESDLTRSTTADDVVRDLSHHRVVD